MHPPPFSAVYHLSYLYCTSTYFQLYGTVCLCRDTMMCTSVLPARYRQINRHPHGGIWRTIHTHTLTSRFRNNQCKDDSALFSRFLYGHSNTLLPLPPQSTYGIYEEYHSVCPLVGTGTLPTLLSPASVPLPPEPGGGGHTRLRVRGWGSPNSDDWKKAYHSAYSETTNIRKGLYSFLLASETHSG